MSYKEFLKATLTTENSNLRIEVSQRVPDSYLLEPNYDKLSYDVKYSLAKLVDT